MNIETILLVALGAFSFAWLFLRPLIVMIAGLRGPKRSDRYYAIPNEGVSILVPAYNESDQIVECLNSIIAQKIYRPYEILVLVNNSTDDTAFKARKFARRNLQVRVFEFNTTPGHNPLSEALNYGLARARYPVIFRMDADTYLGAEDTIEQAIYPIVSGKAVGTCCNVRINKPGTILEKFQAIEYFLAMELERKFLSMIESVICCSGATQAWKTDALREIGGWNLDPHCPEDMDLTIRMHRKGRIAMNPLAISYTDAPNNLKELTKQRFLWTYLGVANMIHHRRSIGNPKVGNKGLFGLVGLPIKVLQATQAIVGIIDVCLDFL